MSRNGKPTPLPPAWFIRILNGFRQVLLKLNRRMFPGNVVLYEQFQYLWLLPSIYTAARLGVANQLRNGPKTASELASLLDCDAGFLYRLLRALASHTIFREDKQGRFHLTPMAKALTDDKGSLRHMLMQHLGPVNWALMGDMMHAVKTGDEVFSHVHGQPMYEFLKSHPANFEIFDKSMSNLSELGLEPILSEYSFKNYKTIADIGGGEGFLLCNIILRNPNAKGILFDLKDALVKAPEMIKEYGLENRVTIAAGDFLKTVPLEACAYILKNVLHNWGDEDCIRILENIRKGMRQDSRIIIMEMIVPKGNAASISKMLDLQMMMAMHGAKERTREEFEILIRKSGLKISRIVRTIAPVSVIEVTQ